MASEHGLRALLHATGVGSGFLSESDSSLTQTQSRANGNTTTTVQSSSAAERFATRITLSQPLHELLRTHPRFAEVFAGLPRDEQDTLRNAWHSPPEGLVNMIQDCWRHDLFEWELMTRPANPPPVASPMKQNALCLSYTNEQYSVWARLVDRSKKSRQGGVEGCYVSVSDMVRFAEDDRAAVANPSTTPQKQRQRGGSPESANLSSPVSSGSRKETVRVNGTPVVGQVLTVVHSLDDSAVCNWSVSDDGWTFTFLCPGEQLRLGADEVHKYVQVDVTTRSACITSRIVFVNVSEDADRGMATLVANCIKEDAPAEFSILADGVPAALFLHLTKKGSRVEVVEGEVPRVDAVVRKCDYQCSSSKAIALTPPNTPSVVLECESMSERDSIALCLRLFAAFPPPLLAHLAASDLDTPALARHLLHRDTDLHFAAGSISTLLMRAESGALVPL